MAKSGEKTSTSRRKRSSAPEPGSPAPAFDLWLSRGLHQMFDDVAQEPIPEDLLRLIEEDRGK